MYDQNWTSEAEEKERKARRIAIAIILIAVFLFVLVLGMMAMLMVGTFKSANEWAQDESVFRNDGTELQISEQLNSTARDQTAQDESTSSGYLEQRLMKITETKTMTENLGIGYDLAEAMCGNSSTCIVKKDGKWGLVSVTGEVLVPLKYERYSYRDHTGWVEFEKNGHFYVHDEQGFLKRLYGDKLTFRQESEEAYLYRTARVYMSDMEITTTIPEILEDDYYGVEYRSSKTWEVLYKAVGGYRKVGVFSLPDETGRAVAIQGDGLKNTIYYITEDGCESRNMELPEGVNGRWFYFPVDYTWADIILSNGWLKVYVCDAVPGFLIDEYEYYLAFLNVDTFEMIKFPEEYQNGLSIYDMGYGNTMAVCQYKESNEYYKYAICKGDKKLTEEIYYWVEFGDTYMVACCDDGVDILNYEGEVLASYLDASGSFINGKMLVYDGTGVYFIDEKLQVCSDYIVKGNIDRCFSRGVVIDDLYYILEEFEE